MCKQAGRADYPGARERCLGKHLASIMLGTAGSMGCFGVSHTLYGIKLRTLL